MSLARTVPTPESFTRIAGAAARFLFPSVCLACRSEPVDALFRGGVCVRCWEEMPELAPQRCGICDVPLPAAEATTCGECLLDAPPFETLRAAVPYRGSARTILLAFKFQGADYLAPRLAQVMVERLEAPDAPQEVTAVPATRRARWRGDHAAESLARSVARALGIPFVRKRLVKIRTTERQSRLRLADREGNVRRAFRGRVPAPPRVLLVDDVATSGATAGECARALLRAGAERVDVWCFARASRDDTMMDDMDGTLR